MRIVVVCLGVCLFLVPQIVFSSPITFDFYQNAGVVSFSDAGLSLSVSADSMAGTEAVGGSITWYSDYGLGVDATGKSDGKTLDGDNGSDDLLFFDFSEEVLLQKVVFSWVGPTDEVRLYAAGELKFDAYIDATLQTSSNVIAKDFLELNLVSSNFSLMAIDDNDSFRVRSLTVEKLEQPIPTPEPSTFLLLSAGVLGMVCWRRR